MLLIFQQTIQCADASPVVRLILNIYQRNIPMRTVTRLTAVTLFYVVAASPAPPLEPGTLPKAWRTGGPNCLEVPAWQVHEYNPDFYILRESGCTHFEKPFLYLIFGRDRALLEDTGAGEVDSAGPVMNVIKLWCARNKRGSIPLLVVHSHAHGDHVAGDAQFEKLHDVELIHAKVSELQQKLKIANWPTDIVQIDLGLRVVDAIPIPGHNEASMAYYDRRTGLLLTGDSFYPGRISVAVAEFATFVASHQRLVDFTRDKPVAHILGTHIEQTRTPFVDYPRGTVYQPDEMALEMSRGDLLEFNESLRRLNGKPERVELRGITLVPRVPAPAPKSN